MKNEELRMKKQHSSFKKDSSFLILNSSFNKMLTIYLARHGQTEENLSRIFQGHLPGHLTEEGKRQAIALGKALENIPLDAIVSSDLQRVADTVRLAVGSRDLPWEKNALLAGRGCR